MEICNDEQRNRNQNFVRFVSIVLCSPADHCIFNEFILLLWFYISAKKQKRTFFFIWTIFKSYWMQCWVVVVDCRLCNCCYLFLSSAKVERMRFSFTFFCSSSVCLKRSCVQLVWRNSQMVKKKTLVPTAQVYLICKQAQTNLNPTKKRSKEREKLCN